MKRTLEKYSIVSAIIGALLSIPIIVGADEPNGAEQTNDAVKLSDPIPIPLRRYRAPFNPESWAGVRLDRSRMNFEYVDFDVPAYNVDFSGSNLSHAKLNNCTFYDCSFKDADLSYAQGCCPMDFVLYEYPDVECHNARFENCDFENALITGIQDITITYQSLVQTRRDENGKLMLQNCKLDVRGASDEVFGDVLVLNSNGVPGKYKNCKDYEENNKACLDLSGCDLTGCRLSWKIDVRDDVPKSRPISEPEWRYGIVGEIFPGSPFSFPNPKGLSLMNKIKLTDAIIHNTGSTFTREDVPAEALMETKDFKERKLVNLLWKPDSKPYDPYDYISFYSHSKPRKLKYDFTDFILINCTFINCDLTDVVFDNCCFINCTFVDCMPHSSKSPTMNVKLGNYDPIEIIDLKTYLTRPYLEDKDHEWVVKPMRGLGSPLIDAAAELREEKR